jgi:hypothetical protein
VILQDLPDPGAVRDSARRILSSEEFQFGPRSDSGLFDGVWEKLRRFFDALGSLAETSPMLAWLIIGACFVVLGLIVAHMVVVIRRAIAASRAPGAAPAAATGREVAAQLLDRARKAAAAGDIPGALTLYLRAAILGLDERGVQRLVETATAREYLSLLRKSLDERTLFERLLAHYEPAVFGRRALGPEPMLDVDTLARKLACATSAEADR